MNERLKAALALPLSRKFIIMALTGALATANAKWNLGLSNEIVLGLVGLAAFVILGIAAEDSAKALANGKADAEASRGRDDELLRGLHALDAKKANKDNPLGIGERKEGEL